MNFEITFHFKQRLAEGVYHFDFVSINNEYGTSKPAGYIIINTTTGDVSYSIYEFIDKIILPADKTKLISNAFDAAKALNKTIG